MGGAQRNQRKRQQQRAAQAAKAVAAARGKNSGRNKTIAAVAVIVVIAAAVIVGVLVTNHNKQEQRAAVIPAKTAPHEYPTKLLDGGVVLAGKQSAPITIDMYEDFICPACGHFFQSDHAKVAEALASGKIKARIHMLNFLDQNSSPPGYSLRSANAALAAAAQGRFPDYYYSLYVTQAQEGSAGYSDDQLISLGKRLNIGGSFAADVNGGKYKSAVKADTQKFEQDVGTFYQNTYQMSYVATPTVMYKGKALDVAPRGNSVTNQWVGTSWLKDLIAGKVDVAPKPQA